MKQAESASRAAETFMKAGDAGAGTDPADLKELKEALAKAEKEAAAAKKDRDSMKAQSESLAKEYDRCVESFRIYFLKMTKLFSLLEEKDKMERKVNVMGVGDKKDD